MMEFSFLELVVIAVIALLVVGPKRLPELARQAGTWIGKARRFVQSVRTDVEREFQGEELKRLLNEQRDEITQLKGMISDTQAEVPAENRAADNQAKAAKEPVRHEPLQARARKKELSADPTTASQPENHDDGK